MFSRMSWIAALGVAFCLVCPGFFPSVRAAAELPDPTRPPLSSGAVVHRKGPPRKWQLTSLLISPERKVAVINGQVVRVGDSINGARLVSIEPGRALLQHAGQNIRLELIAGSVRQPLDPAP